MIRIGSEWIPIQYFRQGKRLSYLALKLEQIETTESLFSSNFILFRSIAE